MHFEWVWCLVTFQKKKCCCWCFFRTAPKSNLKLLDEFRFASIFGCLLGHFLVGCCQSYPNNNNNNNNNVFISFGSAHIRFSLKINRCVSMGVLCGQVWASVGDSVCLYGVLSQNQVIITFDIEILIGILSLFTRLSSGCVIVVVFFSFIFAFDGIKSVGIHRNLGNGIFFFGLSCDEIMVEHRTTVNCVMHYYCLCTHTYC